MALVLYDDAQEYIDACSKNSDLKSDIVFAIDYYPEDNYGWWDTLRQNALKENGKAFAVHDFLLDGEWASGSSSMSNLNYYLSEGTEDELLHYEWVLKGEPVTWKTTDETRIVNGKKLHVKVPDYGKYNLKRIKEIPQRIQKMFLQDPKTGEFTIPDTLVEPSIPEIINTKKQAKQDVSDFASALKQIK